MDKTITLTFADIIQKATMLSAFEAKQSVNTDGESHFNDVRIYDKDHTAIKAYITEGAKLIEANLATAFTINSTTEEDTITWLFTDIDTRRTTLTPDKFTEALVAYTLARWLENKIPNTAQAYVAMYKDLADAAVKTAKTKRKPQRPQQA